MKPSHFHITFPNTEPGQQTGFPVFQRDVQTSTIPSVISLDVLDSLQREEHAALSLSGMEPAHWWTGAVNTDTSAKTKQCDVIKLSQPAEIKELPRCKTLSASGTNCYAVFLVSDKL